MTRNEGRQHDCHVEAIDVPVNRAAARHADRLRLSITGMGCSSCAHRVHNALVSGRGIIAADVRLDAGSALVLYDPQIVGVEGILDLVDRAGRESGHSYRAIPVDGG